LILSSINYPLFKGSVRYTHELTGLRFTISKTFSFYLWYI